MCSVFPNAKIQRPSEYIRQSRDRVEKKVDRSRYMMVLCRWQQVQDCLGQSDEWVWGEIYIAL